MVELIFMIVFLKIYILDWYLYWHHCKHFRALMPDYVESNTLKFARYPITRKVLSVIFFRHTFQVEMINSNY